MEILKKILKIAILIFAALFSFFACFFAFLGIPYCPLPTAAGALDSHWSAVAPDSSWDGWEQSLSTLEAIALDSKGRLYVAGNFTQIGGLKTAGIARWDPTDGSWHALGNGLKGLKPEINNLHLAIDRQDRVYVSGTFNVAGDMIAKGIAMWDGQTWHDLDGGLMDGKVNAMALDERDNLYVGGNFTRVGNIFSQRIAFWNGKGWQAVSVMSGKLADQLGSPPEEVNELAYDPARKILYASGRDIRYPYPKDFLAGWQEDDQTWKILADDSPFYFFALEIMSTGELAIGGMNEHGFTYYDPKQPNVYPNHFTVMENRRFLLNDEWDLQNHYPHATDLASSQDGKVFMSGHFDILDGRCTHGVAVWDGKVWSSLGSGIIPDSSINPYVGPVLSLATDSHGILFVAGEFQSAGGKPIHHLARWTP